MEARTKENINGTEVEFITRKQIVVGWIVRGGQPHGHCTVIDIDGYEKETAAALDEMRREAVAWINERDERRNFEESLARVEREAGR